MTADPTPVAGSIRGPWPEAGQGPAPMDHHEKMRLRQAASWAKRVYPGPVGELVSRELLSWEEFGYRFGRGSLIAEVVEHVTKQHAARAEAAA